MTDEEKEKYRGGLIATCKTYCHIDYDDDIEILELMLDTTLDEMTELIPNFDRNNLTSRQKLLAFMSVKELYDNRDKYLAIHRDLKLAASLPHQNQPPAASWNPWEPAQCRWRTSDFG